MDLAFLRLYLNDFASAKKGDDPNTVQIDKRPFIVQQPCETFCQFSNVKEGIAFVGGIKVELITCDETVKADITPLFFYETVVVNAIPQIVFEFGRTGLNFYTTPLFLRITDLVNGNLYYSNGFLITDYNNHLTTRCEYTNFGRFRGIPYDLKPRTQSIRFAWCYYMDSANTKSVKTYTQTNGLIANFRDVVTFGKLYQFEQLDIAIDNRLNEMFSHDTVFVDGERGKLQAYEPKEIKGETNFKTATFKVNPQGQYSTLGFQIFEPLELQSFTPSGRYGVDAFQTTINGTFNQAIALGVGTFKIFDEYNNLIVTFTQADIVIDGNSFEIDNSGFDVELGFYHVIISSGLFLGVGCNDFSITKTTDWAFSIQIGDYDSDDYDNDEYTT